MAGTNRINIVLLHQDQIHHSLFHADSISGEGIAVVTIYAAEFHLLTVNQNHTVLNFDGTETDLLSDHFFFTFQNQGVLLGVFGIPFDYIFHFKGHITAFYILLTHDLAFRIHQGSLNRYAAAYIVNIYAQLTILIIVYQIHMGKEVTNVVLGTQHQIYITEDTAHTQLVLIFQITAIAPFQNQYSQVVITLNQQVGNIELTGGMAYLAVAGKLTVHPYIKARIYTFKAQVVTVGAFILNFKITLIYTARVLCGHIGRIIGERIVYVGVLMTIVTMILPYRRHGNLIVSNVLSPEIVGQIIHAVEIAESPHAIQQQESVRHFTIANQRFIHCAERYIVGTVIHITHMQGLGIFVILDDVHNLPPGKISYSSILCIRRRSRQTSQPYERLRANALRRGIA